MPLTFDLPIEELKTYQGVNPRPSDFETFWDKSLAEMHAIDPKVELVPAQFQTPLAECFHMYFIGVDDARAYAKLPRSRKAQSPHPAVLMFHGYTEDSGDWMGRPPPPSRVRYGRQVTQRGHGCPRWVCPGKHVTACKPLGLLARNRNSTLMGDSAVRKEAGPLRNLPL